MVMMLVICSHDYIICNLVTQVDYIPSSLEKQKIIIKPRCPCAARVTVLCLFVCLFVCLIPRYAARRSHSTSKVWCQQVTNGVFYSLYGRIFVKRFTSRVMQLFAYLDRPWRHLREVCTAKDSLQCCL